MDLDFTDEQEMLREMVRGVCSSYADLDVVRAMEAWLSMNWIRGWTTDLPALVCFVVAALKAL